MKKKVTLSQNGHAHIGELTNGCCSDQNNHVNNSSSKALTQQLSDLSVAEDDAPPLETANICSSSALSEEGVEYSVYQNELQMPDIMRLIQKDLSEPYSIYTYRYFIHNWPHLCFMVRYFYDCTFWTDY